MYGLMQSVLLINANSSVHMCLILGNLQTSFSSQDGRRKIVDPVVLTTSSQESLSIVISLTNKCISADDSASRPSFEDVLWNLQYAAQVQTTADADQRSETTSLHSFS